MRTDAKPLRGLKVLDLTQAWAGPYCTMMLADVGAEVVKIEPPGVGDHVRRWTVSSSKGESPHFIAVNRNKRSITLNLKHPDGRKIFLRLAAQSDVVIENFRPGVMTRFGLDYEAVRKVAPKAIYCSVSGFGQTGPRSGDAAYDLIIQSVGGAMSVTGEEGGRPLKPGIPQGDVMGALGAAFTILATLYGRGADGKGRYLDLAMLDMQISAMAFHIVSYALSGDVPLPMGARHPLLAPYESFRTATAEITIAIANDHHWQRLCEVLDLSALGTDAKFATNSTRVDHRDELASLIENVTETQPAEFWLTRLNERGIPCGPINRVNDLFDDPQVRHRKMLISLDHPTLGRVTVPGIPWKLVPPEEEEPPTAPPTLGQHTGEVLQQLGYSIGEIESLRHAGAV